ncbi:MAG: YkgJ family cysteine cluster protein [Anaerolineae bacterium]
MYIETDLDRIKQLAEIREDENWEFRSYLKASSLSSKRLDAIVHELYAQVAAAIDCRTCANCCRAITPTPTAEEIETLAAVLQMTAEQFRTQYLYQNNDKAGRLLRPCPLLKGNECSVYPHRPRECAAYPYLQRNDFRTRLFGVLDNYAICPIVFNVYEQLKEQLWHRRRKHARF